MECFEYEFMSSGGGKSRATGSGFQLGQVGDSIFDNRNSPTGIPPKVLCE